LDNQIDDPLAIPQPLEQQFAELKLSPDMAALLISMACRLPQAMSNVQQPQIEKALQAIFSTPELQRLARYALRRLQRFTPQQWDDMVTDFIEHSVLMTRNILLTAGSEDIFAGLTSEQQTSTYLSKLGWEGPRENFVKFFQEQFVSGYAKLASGEELDPSLIQGLFTTELEHTNSLFQLIMLTMGGSELMETIDDLIADVEWTLLKSAEWVVALCLMEMNYKLAGESLELNNALAELRNKHTWWLRNRVSLMLPGPHEEINGRTYWSEELSLAEITVYRVLLNRVIRDPVTVFFDAWKGNLGAYLKKAIKNDILQEIDYRTAQKRNVRKEDSMNAPSTSHDEKQEDGPGSEDTLISPEPGAPAELEMREAYDTIMDGLSMEERKALELIIEGYNQKEVAEQLGHVPSWVTKVRQRAQKKVLRNYSYHDGVAKSVAKDIHQAQKGDVSGTKRVHKGRKTA